MTKGETGTLEALVLLAEREICVMDCSLRRVKPSNSRLQHSDEGEILTCFPITPMQAIEGTLPDIVERLQDVFNAACSS